MEQLIFTSIPLDRLAQEVSQAVKKELQALASAQPAPAPHTEFLTRKQAAQLLGVSLPTLWQWSKEGLIQGYRIGSRVRYKRGEVEKALVAMRTTKRRAA